MAKDLLHVRQAELLGYFAIHFKVATICEKSLVVTPPEISRPMDSFDPFQRLIRLVRRACARLFVVLLFCDLDSFLVVMFLLLSFLLCCCCGVVRYVVSCSPHPNSSPRFNVGLVYVYVCAFLIVLRMYINEP